MQPRRGGCALVEIVMNKLVLAFGPALITGLFAFGVQAQTVVSDTDGNGTYSVEEMSAAYPKMTSGLFQQLDVDGNGGVDADELQAGRENGLIGN
jgi:hypothetical protein